MLKAFFPNVPTIALTATAPPQLLKKLQNKLHLKHDCKVVAVNPNRVNIYLEKKMRSGDHKVIESYHEILEPIAIKLLTERENFPMTIIYLKLKYCALAYRLFERILQDKQYVGDCKEPVARLFVQFHSPQTSRMKKELIKEIKKADSRVRVVFATSALGMGVDAPYVTKVIHISPPSNLESYMQEIGRAGRTGIQSHATLYFNNSDIGKNKSHVEDSVRNYCRSTDTCLRKQLLEYFGFRVAEQSNCCSVCDGGCAIITKQDVKRDVSRVVNSGIDLKSLIENALAEYEHEVSSLDCSLFNCMLINKDLADSIVKKVEYIETELDLLNDFGIWDEVCSSKVFSVISKNTMLCVKNS